MANFTTEEILRHPLYKAAWDIYDVWFQNGRKWPDDVKAVDSLSDCPLELGQQHTGDLRYVAWQCAAWSACGSVWRGNFDVPGRTPPRGVFEQEQLGLFDYHDLL